MLHVCVSDESPLVVVRGSMTRGWRTRREVSDAARSVYARYSSRHTGSKLRGWRGNFIRIQPESRSHSSVVVLCIAEIHAHCILYSTVSTYNTDFFTSFHQIIIIQIEYYSDTMYILFFLLTIMLIACLSSNHFD